MAYQIESAAFSLFIFLPLLPGIPIAAWYLMEKGSPSLLNHTQQLLRTGAGHDELMVRELEKQKSNCSESNNSG